MKTFKKVFNVVAKVVTLVNLVVCVCRGENVVQAQIDFNNAWN